jgi:hypothetical protein
VLSRIVRRESSYDISADKPENVPVGRSQQAHAISHGLPKGRENPGLVKNDINRDGWDDIDEQAYG